MLGTPFASYAQNIVGEVISLGRVGSLVDWEGESENRVYVSAMPPRTSSIGALNASMAATSSPRRAV